MNNHLNMTHPCLPITGKLAGMTLPAGTSAAQCHIMTSLLTKLHRLLFECNSYLRDFKSILEQYNENPDFATNHVLVINADARPEGAHERRYNESGGTNEVAVLINDATTGNVVMKRDIVIHIRGGGVCRIDDTHRSYDALHFVLLNPEGKDGWNITIPLSGANPLRKTVTCTKYYSFYLHTRDNCDDTLFRGGRLFQEYVCCAALKIEAGKLNWLRHNQGTIRAELYNHAADAVSTGHISTVGKLIVLPSTFIGGPRDMHARYQDAMAVVRKFGKPDLFITMTCNPKWSEIQSELFPGQSPSDRCDLEARVFYGKLEAVHRDLLDNGIFGRKVANMHVIEYQVTVTQHVSTQCCHQIKVN